MGSATGAAPGPSEAAGQSLAALALPALRLCLARYPLETEQAATLCGQLSASVSWHLPAQPDQAAQQAAAAVLLVEGLLGPTEEPDLARHASLVWRVTLACLELLRRILRQKAPSEQARASAAALCVQPPSHLYHPQAAKLLDRLAHERNCKLMHRCMDLHVSRVYFFSHF